MKLNQVLKAQIETTHNVLARTLADCDDATLHRIEPGSTAGSIASTYAHVVFAEDRLINQVARGGTTVFEAGGWAKKLGIAQPDGAYQDANWAAAVRMDPAKFAEYFAAVRAEVEPYFASITEAELDRMVPGIRGGESPVAQYVNIVIYHNAEHTGEIAALKGVQGQKGLPF